MARISSGIASLPRSWSRLAVRMRSSSPCGRSIARASASGRLGDQRGRLAGPGRASGERREERLLRRGHRRAADVERGRAGLGTDRRAADRVLVAGLAEDVDLVPAERLGGVERRVGVADERVRAQHVAQAAGDTRGERDGDARRRPSSRIGRPGHRPPQLLGQRAPPRRRRSPAARPGTPRRRTGPTMSTPRTLSASRWATCRSTTSPAAWPCVSLRRLKWSRSTMTTESGPSIPGRPGELLVHARQARPGGWRCRSAGSTVASRHVSATRSASVLERTRAGADRRSVRLPRRTSAASLPAVASRSASDASAVVLAAHDEC